MSDKAFNLGLIGAGRIGQVHAGNLSGLIPGVSLSMVADVDAASATACAKRFRIPHSSADYHDVLNDRDIDAVIICSSTDTHTRIVEEAAAVGKHVFCEKPIDLDLKRIDAAIAAVDQAGIVLQVGFQRRFDTAFQRVRKAVATGEIGTPHQLHIVSRDPAPPPSDYIRKSGGIFLDMTIHDFDMARFLIGAEVEEVYATGSVLIDPVFRDAGDYDTATTILKFANGTVGVIENSRRAVFGHDQRVEVFGSDGCIATDNVHPNTARISVEDKIYSDPPMYFFLERYRDAYIEEMKQFLDASMSGGSSPVSGSEARKPVVIGNAALLSCRENRPVRIEEIQ